MKTEIEKKKEAQAKYCIARPHLAPLDGICFSCHRQIYEAISLNKARTTHITGCPHCNRTFCD